MGRICWSKHSHGDWKPCIEEWRWVRSPYGPPFYLAYIKSGSSAVLWSIVIFIYVKTIQLKCDNCGNQFEKSNGEYNRRVRLGKTKFYCCQSCASVDTNTKHKEVTRKCLWCQVEFLSSTHKKHKKCCSDLCARKVIQSYVDTDNIAKSLIKFHKKNGSKTHIPKECPHCNKKFIGRSKYCSKECVRGMKRAHLPAYEKYKRECQFDFGIRDYPSEFDFSLIEKYGWYKPKNHGDNLGGVSRDHIMSVKWGFENGIDPKYIRHPANCQLLRHNDNVSKGKKESITLDILLERIRVWDSKYSGI